LGVNEQPSNFPDEAMFKKSYELKEGIFIWLPCAPLDATVEYNVVGRKAIV